MRVQPVAYSLNCRLTQTNLNTIRKAAWNWSLILLHFSVPTNSLTYWKQNLNSILKINLPPLHIFLIKRHNIPVACISPRSVKKNPRKTSAHPADTERQEKMQQHLPYLAVPTSDSSTHMISASGAHLICIARGQPVRGPRTSPAACRRRLTTAKPPLFAGHPLIMRGKNQGVRTLRVYLSAYEKLGSVACFLS